MTTDTSSLVRSDRKTLDSDDGHCINAYVWEPENGAISGTVQILHGLAEHAARYERFATYLVDQGFAVVAHNHRGHGAARQSDHMGHFADKDGWQKMLDDVAQVHQFFADRHPGTPRLLFGHSMGSYIAQAFLIQQPNSVNALVLSGSTSAPRFPLYLGRFVARIEMLIRGRRHPSESLNKQAFGAFNKRFEPARTDFDWLSRDPEEVDKYVADAACGFLPTAGLWHDLLGGLIQIGKRQALQNIPADLPILITGGSDDPVGGQPGMERLLTQYQSTGHGNVTLRVFEDARHEMLNETNRDEFTLFVTGWSKSALR